MRILSLILLTLILVGLVGCTNATTTAPPALTVTTATLSEATINVAYTQQLTASGGVAPYTWSVIAGNLPAGITLSPAGLLAGTPTQSGSFSFTVQVVDSAATTDTLPIKTRELK
jgi:large repetitive protein